MAKGPNAFRTISEAADELGVPQHVLRFWETKFSFIRPMKRAGGRRFYRPQDIAVLNGVRKLLHDEGYTIKGVQKLHKDLGVKRLLEAGQGGGVSPVEGAVIESVDLSPESRNRLSFALDDLNAVKARLDALLKH
ncbi:MerR family transcriptional regulator [Caulobacter sp. NIBR2454]|uniref:MerR family transcriptional regulator n=1 Tax=Caulobacter sp. NIBR2454 TaxID=3015996 RepID=UPI0022B649A0|nr:MerR family transcriptional regulator [Caulobacter sp. NIBR2454]